MNVFFELIANILAAIYAVFPNYAIAIIGLTMAIMIVLTPLTLKGTRSMMVMQQLQPEMKKIQTRYKDDRQKLNEELLKFYKENDISPLGGCLPLLVQMPVFIVLYQVLRGLTRRVSGMGFDMGWISGQLGIGSSPSKVPTIERNFDPAYLNHNSKMYQSLSNTNTMQAFGMDLAESASKAMSQGVGHAWPYLTLILIVGVTGFVQQRQIQGRNPNQQVNPQQQMIMKIMPVFLPVISFGLPAGLVLYFAVSNLYRVGQQWFISRSIYGIKGSAGGGAGKAAGSTSPKAPAGTAKAIKAESTEVEETPAPSKRAGSAKQAQPPEPASGGGLLAGIKRAAAARADGTGTNARANGSRSTSTKAASAKKPAAKPATKGGAKSGSGRQTTTGRVTPSKASATKTPSAPADKKPGTPAPSSPPSNDPGSGAPSAPTLQPRARKKKR